MPKFAESIALRIVVLAVLGTVAACSGKTDSSDGRADGPASASDTDVPGTKAVSSTESPKRVFTDDSGSFTLAAVTLGGVGCDPNRREMTYDRASRQMTWPACTGPDAPPPTGTVPYKGTPYALSERVLTPTEAEEVEAAIAKLTYTENPPSGFYDGLDYFLTTTSATGAEQKYSAYNVNNYNYRKVPALKSLYDLFAVLRER